METILFDGCRARIVGPIGAQTMVYLPVGGLALEPLCELLPDDVLVVALDQTDWNRDFSPWATPAVFRDGDFTGGAPAFLRLLTETILPAVEARTGRPARRILAGYSLAGLFAAWAVMNTDCFHAAASVSGSLWFDGFMDYARVHLTDLHASAVYLSVGDRERNTRSARMRQVEDCTRKLYRLLDDAGVRAVFELNPGNHFVDAPQRLARGIRWLLEQSE